MAVGRQLERRAVDDEGPLVQLRRRAVGDGPVPAQVVGVLGCAGTGQVRRYGIQRAAQAADAPRDLLVGQLVADANGDVKVRMLATRANSRRSSKASLFMPAMTLKIEAALQYR